MATAPLHPNGFQYQPTFDLNRYLREYGQVWLNTNLPPAPQGSINVFWQTDSLGNISAYCTGGGGGGGGGTPVQASTFASTITGTIPGSVFVLPSVPDVGSLLLATNGQLLTPGEDYTITGSTVTLTVGLEDGDGLSAYYLINSDNGNFTSVSVVLGPTTAGNFTVPHTLGTVPTGVIFQMTSGGQIYFQSPVLYDANNLYLVASDDGLTGFAQVFSASGGEFNFVTSALNTSAPGDITIPHTLGTVPAGVIIQMTSGGQVWFQSPVLFDADNVYLVASDAGLTGFVQVFGS